MQVADQLDMPPGAAGTADEADGPEADALGDPLAPGAYPPGMRGGPGPGEPPMDPAFEEAQLAMERGDLDAAAAAFERVLAASPGHPIATLGLAQVDLIRRVNSYDQAQARRAAAENPDDVDAQARVADIDLAMGRVEEAFDRLLGTIKRTSGEDRDQARRHLISLFEIFPPRDPLVSKARSTLSSLLF
jgi:putative thioredoxin